MKQKSIRLAMMTRNMFGGEKVRPLTPTSPCCQAVVSCTEHVLLLMELVLYRKSMDFNEERGLLPNASREAKIISQKVGSWAQLSVPTGQ